MNRICRTFNFVAYLALLTAGPAFTQTLSDEATPEAIAAASVAHVYVQTHKGVAVYDASATGKLTLVKGSLFADTGQMEGINGGYLISVGTNYLHTYKIESSGGVGKQASEINTQDYDGAQCGTTAGAGAILDHTGKYFYVQLFGASYGGNTTCADWQSYQIEPDGAFTFLGSLEAGGGADGSAYASTVPTISSNDKFGYSITGGDCNCNSFVPFAKAATGQITLNSAFTYVGPQSDPTARLLYEPTFAKADSTGHLAVLTAAVQNEGDGNIVSWQLASFTIDNATGSIISTNTVADMPTPQLPTPQEYGAVMEMSPSGKLLALAGGGNAIDGLQIFHFNGAAPITEYSALLLPAVDIDQLAWDNDNHLYALSYSSGELYVYTITPTSIKEVSGSPYKVENAYGNNGLIVVPKL
jgi:hypothetical protein